MWNFSSPIALFASKPISQGKNELVPVAIQMDFTPGMYEPFFYWQESTQKKIKSFYIKYFMY